MSRRIIVRGRIVVSSVLFLCLTMVFHIFQWCQQASLLFQKPVPCYGFEYDFGCSPPAFRRLGESIVRD
jgi:hypothetical protein